MTKTSQVLYFFLSLTFIFLPQTTNTMNQSASANCQAKLSDFERLHFLEKIKIGKLDLKECNSYGQNWLSIFAEDGETQLVDAVFSSGFKDVEIRDHQGSTALDWAIYYGHVETARTILSQARRLSKLAPLINNVDNLGQTVVLTALHHSIKHERPPMLRLLFEFGAKKLINVKNVKYHTTPLDKAISENDSDVVIFLLKNGAQICAESKYRISSEQIAKNIADDIEKNASPGKKKSEMEKNKDIQFLLKFHKANLITRYNYSKLAMFLDDVDNPGYKRVNDIVWPTCANEEAQIKRKEDIQKFRKREQEQKDIRAQEQKREEARDEEEAEKLGKLILQNDYTPIHLLSHENFPKAPFVTENCPYGAAQLPQQESVALPASSSQTPPNSLAAFADAILRRGL